MNRIITLIAILTLHFTATGQTRIYSITSGIAGQPTNDTLYVNYFDYATGVFGTSHKLPHTSRSGNFYTTIDPFNGRYFFITQDSNYTPFFTIADLSNPGSFSQPLNMTNMDWGQMEYDYFDNCIYFRTFLENQLTRLNLDSFTLDSVCVIQSVGGYSWGLNRAYDPINMKMFDHSSIIDLVTGSETKIDLYDQMICNYAFDHVSGKFYAATASHGLISVDPFTADFITVVDDDSIGAGVQNMLQPVFDSRNGLYFGFYPSQTNPYDNLIAFDVNSGSIAGSYYYNAESWLQEFYGMYDPIVRIDTSAHDTELMSVHAWSYQWYKSEFPGPGVNPSEYRAIAGAMDQKYKPTEPGRYKVEATFYDGRHAFSEPIQVSTSGISSLPIAVKKQGIYPNPLHEKAVFEFDRFYNEPYTLVLYNITGAKVKVYENISSGAVIDRDGLAEGVYHYRLLCNNLVQMNGKLVIH